MKNLIQNILIGISVAIIIIVFIGFSITKSVQSMPPNADLFVDLESLVYYSHPLIDSDS